MTKKKSSPPWYWHVHHDILVEPLTEDLDKRIQYIRKFKAADEITTRLRLLRPVVGAIPDALQGAADDLERLQVVVRKADKAVFKARKRKDIKMLNEAWSAYARITSDQTRAEEHFKNEQLDAASALEALHVIECGTDCPWNGETIFPQPVEADAVSV